MGDIKKIIYNSKAIKPILNNRLIIELCENVHLHYRNIRLEFTKEEFLKILMCFQNINPGEINKFQYSKENYKVLCSDYTLPETTEFDDRIQYEEQINGQYHFHYRNMRLEFKSTNELPVEVDNYSVNPRQTRDLLRKNFHFQSIKKFKLSELYVGVFTQSKRINFKVKESPIYKSLINKNYEIYTNYIEVILEKKGTCEHNLKKFKLLINSIEKNGYNQSDLILVKKNPNGTTAIIDGHHRAAIMFYLFGNITINTAIYEQNI